MIEKNRHCSVPEGLSHDPYIESVFLRIEAESNRSRGSRLRHLWPNQRFTTSNGHIFRPTWPQIACWGKINEHDCYKTSFTRDSVRPDDVPGSSDIPLHFKRNAASLGQRSED